MAFDWLPVLAGAAGTLVVLSVCAVVWLVRYTLRRLDDMEQRIESGLAYLTTHTDRSIAALNGQVKHG